MEQLTYSQRHYQARDKTKCRNCGAQLKEGDAKTRCRTCSDIEKEKQANRRIDAIIAGGTDFEE